MKVVIIAVIRCFLKDTLLLGAQVGMQAGAGMTPGGGGERGCV